MPGRRICLFGGTFDPIHMAHLKIAAEAVKRFDLDRVLFVPAANPPHKKAAEVTPYEDRFRMVELACAPYPNFTASRLEEGKERSYTVDTLERFRKELDAEDRLFFLIGSDAFDELETWKRWRDVVKLTEFIVVRRPGDQYHIPESARFEPLDGLDLPVASTRIRARLRSGEATPELPKQVRKFIEERGLYGAGKKGAATASRSRRTDRKLSSGA
jgi:nicotinate-nucleotide adenylyltransferase